MSTPANAPYKLRQQEGRRPKHTKWNANQRLGMALGHRAGLVEVALAARNHPRVIKTTLPGGVLWWPQLAPLTPSERARVRVGRR